VLEEEGFGMVDIAICDDEEYFRIREKNLIIEYMEKRNIPYQIAMFSSGKELLERFDLAPKYSIIFLDVNMEVMDGLETARRIRTISKDVHLIFVTAFITYALEGYKVDAVRYILKDDACLEQSMTECLDAVLHKINNRKEKKLFTFQDGEMELALDNIMYVESNLHKLYFHLLWKDSGKFCMYEKLDAMENLLKPYHFCRIHKSYLVNLKYIDRMERYWLTLSNGRQLNIAKVRYPQVKSEFISYWGEV
jgi:DNA-binding LytR/AlgR family response regulator